MKKSNIKNYLLFLITLFVINFSDIGKVDTKLLETVALEYFKPVDVQHADIQPLATAVLRLHNGALCRFKSIVDHGDEPLEQLVVKRLC